MSRKSEYWGRLLTSRSSGEEKSLNLWRTSTCRRDMAIGFFFRVITTIVCFSCSQPGESCFRYVGTCVHLVQEERGEGEKCVQRISAFTRIFSDAASTSIGAQVDEVAVLLVIDKMEASKQSQGTTDPERVAGIWVLIWSACKAIRLF